LLKQLYIEKENDGGVAVVLASLLLLCGVGPSTTAPFILPKLLQVITEGSKIMDLWVYYGLPHVGAVAAPVGDASIFSMT